MANIANVRAVAFLYMIALENVTKVACVLWRAGVYQIRQNYRFPGSPSGTSFAECDKCLSPN